MRAMVGINNTNLKDIKNSISNNNIAILYINGALNFPVNLDFLNFKYPFSNITELLLKNFELNNFANVNKNIKEIYMTNLHMTNIGSNYFVGLYKLKDLFISMNNISVIKNLTFVELKSLKMLHLNNNNIKYIESRAFLGLYKLVELKLDNNLIVELKMSTFDIFEKSSIYFHIENNLLSTIDENVFGKLNNLKSFDISNNNIKCNCQKLKWILNHAIINHLNRSKNNYIKCHTLKTSYFELIKTSKCNNMKGKYIYIYIYIYIYSIFIYIYSLLTSQKHGDYRRR